MRIEVLDDGPGLAHTHGNEGRPERIGTSNTRRRLHQLHGNAASFTLSNRDGGGACSAVEWPIPKAP
jgi:sensor histidine kinase YesM